jgi:hypothetical protein
MINFKDFEGLGKGWPPERKLSKPAPIKTYWQVPLLAASLSVSSV